MLLMCAMPLDESSLPGGSQAALVRFMVDFITAIRATVVSLEMYPPGSKTIANAVEKVSSHLEKVLEIKASVTLAEVSGMLLVDGQQLDERDRKKAPVVDFIASLMERSVQSITFTRPANSAELIEFLVIMSKKPKDLKDLGPLQDQLNAKQITGIQLNQRIYVATSQEEQEALKRQESLLNALLLERDGKPPEDIDQNDLRAALGNREHLSESLRKLSTTIDAEVDNRIRDPYEAIVEKARRLGEVLERGFTVMGTLEDERLRENFIEGLVDMLAEKEPAVLEHLFYMEKMSPSVISQMNIEPPLFIEMAEDRVMGYTEAIFEELREVREQFPTMQPEEKQGHVDAIRGMVKSLVTNTMQREFFPEIIGLLEGNGLLKHEAAQQLLGQAANVPKVAEGLRNVQLLNTDGTVDQDSLDFAIEQFESLTPDAIVNVLTGFGELMGEIIFHQKLPLLIEKIALRMDQEQDFSLVYKSCADFAEHLTRELIFNELYKHAGRLLALFQSHASAEIPRHVEQRKRAVAALEAVSSEDVTRMLLSVFQHGEQAAQEEVGALMIRMGPRMLSVLFDLLKSTEDRRLRRQLLALLKGVGSSLVSLIVEELPRADAQWFVTRNLLVLLQDVGGPDQAGLATPFLTHGDVRVRKEAAKTLMTLDVNSAREVLRTQLTDRDVGIKRFAITNLGVMKDTESIPYLTGLITKRTIAQVEEEEEVQIDAVGALGRMGDPSVVPALIEALRKEGMFSKKRTKTPTIRGRACFALASYRSPEAETALKQAAKDGQAAVADAAKTVLRGWGL